MLHAPESLWDFAKYTTKNPRELLLGYEYEIDWPNAGAPASVSSGQFRSLDPDDIYSVKVPKGYKGTDRTTSVNPIRNLPNFFHVSYECLGANDGYEIKSVIAPMSIHKRLIKRILFNGVTFNDKPNGPKNEGGIHVSINRNEITNPLQNKVFSFIHLNFPRDILLKLSERTRDNLNSFAHQTPYINRDELYRDQGRKSNHAQDSHYAVINCENRNRFEFRLFAAQKHLLIPAIEMADSIFNAAQDIEDLTVESWMNYIQSKIKYASIAQHVRSKLNA